MLIFHDELYALKHIYIVQIWHFMNDIVSQSQFETDGGYDIDDVNAHRSASLYATIDEIGFHRFEDQPDALNQHKNWVK